MNEEPETYNILSDSTDNSLGFIFKFNKIISKEICKKYIELAEKSAKDKYTLTDEIKKCLEEAESLKKQLDKLTNDNWDVERLFVDKQAGRGRGGAS